MREGAERCGKGRAKRKKRRKGEKEKRRKGESEKEKKGKEKEKRRKERKEAFRLYWSLPFKVDSCASGSQQASSLPSARCFASLFTCGGA